MADPTDVAAQAAPPTLLGTLQDVFRELPGLVGDRVELLSLELKRAGLALAQIVGLVVFAAILGVTAWLALWAGIFTALVRTMQLHWSVGLAIVMAINLLCAALALARARRLSPLLGLPATQRHLSFRHEPVMPRSEPPSEEKFNGQPAT